MEEIFVEASFKDELFVLEFICFDKGEHTYGIDGTWDNHEGYERDSKRIGDLTHGLKYIDDNTKYCIYDMPTDKSTIKQDSSFLFISKIYVIIIHLTQIFTIYYKNK